MATSTRRRLLGYHAEAAKPPKRKRTAKKTAKRKRRAKKTAVRKKTSRKKRR